MLEMTKERSEENVERKTKRATVETDFETATATKIRTARGQVMVKGMEVYRRKGRGLRQIGKQVAMTGEMEEVTALLTEQASDLTFVGLARADSFATGVNLRCETKIAQYVTKWLPEKPAGTRQ